MSGFIFAYIFYLIAEPAQPFATRTVRSVIMVLFRDGKSPDDEQKFWQYWHSRQHSTKQRILDADTKNSVGICGQIEELSHNALAVYWNPLESPAKVNKFCLHFMSLFYFEILGRSMIFDLFTICLQFSNFFQLTNSSLFTFHLCLYFEICLRFEIFVQFFHFDYTFSLRQHSKWQTCLQFQ